jgi:hypothetical protein
MHEFAAEQNSSIEQPSCNTHPHCRCTRIRRFCHSPSPIFAADSHPISSKIKSPPQISTSPSPEQPTNLVSLGRQCTRSMGLSSLVRIVQWERDSRHALRRWGACGTLTVAPCAFGLPEATCLVDVNVSQYQIESLLDMTVVGRSPPPKPPNIQRPKPRWDLALVSTV